MQPFVHAQISARQGGRNWQDDLPIHEFMDIAKHACPDLRHRLVLHNADLGPHLAAMAFPDRVDAKDIALSHVKQDLGWMPPLEAWLALCDPAFLPQTKRKPEQESTIVQSAAAYFGLKDTLIIQHVWDLLMLPAKYAPMHRHLAHILLMNSLGPILARIIFGPPRAYARSDGGTTIVDFSWMAEGMIVAYVGQIYSLDRVLRCFNGGEPKKAF